jgi:hypothetical protein
VKEHLERLLRKVDASCAVELEDTHYGILNINSVAENGKLVTRCVIVLGMAGRSTAEASSLGHFLR